MPFHLSLTPMDPLSTAADFPDLSIAPLGSTSLIMQIRLDDPSPPYSPTAPPRSNPQGVVLVLRLVKPPPRIPPSLRRRRTTSTSSTLPTPSPPPHVTVKCTVHRGAALKRQPRAIYIPPTRSLSRDLFHTLPFVFGWGCTLPAPIPCQRLSKRRRDEGDVGSEAGWTSWVFGSCRRIKRRTV